MKTIENYRDSEHNFRRVLPSLMEKLNDDSRNEYYEKIFQNFLKYLGDMALASENADDRKKYTDRLTDVSMRKRITNDDIAFISGKNKSTVTRWLDFSNPTIPTATVICDIATAFGVTTDYLLGFSDTPEIRTEEDYKVLRKYGLNPDCFIRLKTAQEDAINSKNEKNIIKLNAVTNAINLLLMQSGEKSFDVISRIGYYLLDNSNWQHYYFDEDDVDNLYDAMFDSSKTKDMPSLDKGFIRATLEDFFKSLPDASPELREGITLDALKNALIDYKKELNTNKENTNC